MQSQAWHHSAKHRRSFAIMRLQTLPFLRRCAWPPPRSSSASVRAPVVLSCLNHGATHHAMPSVVTASSSASPISASITPFDVSLRARQLKVGLSPEEIDSLKRECIEEDAANSGGVLTHSAFLRMVRASTDMEAERQAMVEYIVKKDEKSAGQRMLLYLDLISTGLFAAVGSIFAGQAGMNVVGAAVVGGVASMGGGTLNNMMTGAASRGGVFWMKDARFLLIAMCASIITFYAWPYYEDLAAERELEALRCAACVDPNEPMNASHFQRALSLDPALARRLFSAVGAQLNAELGTACTSESERTQLLFEWLVEHSAAKRNELSPQALAEVARLEAMSSPELYALETIALGAVAVIGAQSGISRGMTPLACVATGVTICFGGILRDLLCQRPLAFGAQSYALATAAGASVYVGLRQLVVAGYHIPLLVRIALGAGTAISQRVYVWLHMSDAQDTFLSPMANYKPRVAAGRAGGSLRSSAEQLCEAAAAGDVHLLRKLVSAGADVNLGDYDRRTALHLAACEGRLRAVRFLVEEAGASLSPEDRWGCTPLDDSIKSKHLVVGMYLRSKGATCQEDADAHALAKKGDVSAGETLMHIQQGAKR
eukprot:6213515-Pleurochrysis_carterae.AAC.2